MMECYIIPESVHCSPTGPSMSSDRVAPIQTYATGINPVEFQVDPQEYYIDPNLKFQTGKW